jgi:hypothetical protein
MQIPAPDAAFSSVAWKSQLPNRKELEKQFSDSVQFHSPAGPTATVSGVQSKPALDLVKSFI